LIRRAGTKSVALDSREQSQRPTRYAAVDARVADNVVGFDAEADLKVGVLNLSLRLQDSLDGAMTSLPVARVDERKANGTVVLDPKFIPPLLDVAAHPRTRGWLDELHGIIRQRADALAGRIAGAATGGVGTTADLLLLMICNRYEPLLSQFRRTSPLHPAQLFDELLKLAGESATFGRDNRRPPEFPVYDHAALAKCFDPVVEEIRQAITKLIDQTAVKIPLIPVRDAGEGYFGAKVADPRLITNGYFVLAVTTQWPLERQRNEIPTTVKIGSTEKLKGLVTYATPGIGLTVLQYPPPQMPFYSQYSYFQLDMNNPMWRAIEISRAMALYVPGKPPGLEMELWAIRT
jgi:type VI secretion system protein ImpJ